MMMKYREEKGCKKEEKTVPALKPIVCVKSALSGYRSVGKTVYTVGLRPNGPSNAEY
ncbi:hypothetical protein [Pantoea sp. BAV 3049]|uniref:hypothetical protein n=1 Tax=Pantoea sp. BAV 3049 TaxID=2654188 RepID=UPI00131CEACA|nr:hypothetical protein [Pantoea sp. BAV 3049]